MLITFLLLDLAYSFRFYFQVFYTHPLGGVCVKNFEPGKMRGKKEEFFNHGKNGSRLAWSSPDAEGLGKLPLDKITA